MYYGLVVNGDKNKVESSSWYSFKVMNIVFSVSLIEADILIEFL